MTFNAANIGITYLRDSATKAPNDSGSNGRCISYMTTDDIDTVLADGYFPTSFYINGFLFSPVVGDTIDVIVVDSLYVAARTTATYRKLVITEV